MKVKETVGRISATVPPGSTRGRGKVAVSGSGGAVEEAVSGIVKGRILTISCDEVSG